MFTATSSGTEEGGGSQQENPVQIPVLSPCSLFFPAQCLLHISFRSLEAGKGRMSGDHSQELLCALCQACPPCPQHHRLPALPLQGFCSALMGPAEMDLPAKRPAGPSEPPEPPAPAPPAPKLPKTSPSAPLQDQEQLLHQWLYIMLREFTLRVGVWSASGSAFALDLILLFLTERFPLCQKSTPIPQPGVQTAVGAQTHSKQEQILNTHPKSLSRRRNIPALRNQQPLGCAGPSAKPGPSPGHNIQV